jgi:hypothetical protein
LRFGLANEPLQNLAALAGPHRLRNYENHQHRRPMQPGSSITAGAVDPSIGHLAETQFSYGDAERLGQREGRAERIERRMN